LLELIARVVAALPLIGKGYYFQFNSYLLSFSHNPESTTNPTPKRKIMAGSGVGSYFNRMEPIIAATRMNKY
jgi:hypothetical protein